MSRSEQPADEQRTSPAFQWNPDYSVGVKAMDDQHRKLFELVDKLSRAMHAGRGTEVVGEVLLSLIDYAKYHFSAEEKLMEKHKYTGLPTHRGEHRYFTEKMQAFQEDCDAGNRGITPELLTFLQKWLKNHIQVVDRRYSRFLNAQGVH
jgi:hemerythrin-like metal-binding protein